MNARGLLTVALLVTAAFASWYLARRNAQPAFEPVVTESEHRGYYLTSARILGTGPDGKLLYEIIADRAEQQADDRIEFTDVRISYAPDSDVPWVVNADMATIYPDQERVMLEGHVRAVSEEGFSGDETEIRTQALELLPQTFVARTDERVQIRIGARSLTGIGMLASLNENRVEIRSNVSGRFVP